MRVLRVNVWTKPDSVRKDKVVKFMCSDYETVLGTLRVTWMYRQDDTGVFEQTGKIVSQKLLGMKFVAELEKAGKVAWNNRVKELKSKGGRV